MKGIFERSTPKETDMNKFMLTNKSWRETKIKKDEKCEHKKIEELINTKYQSKFNELRKSQDQSSIIEDVYNYEENNIIANIIGNSSPRQTNNEEKPFDSFK